MGTSTYTRQRGLVCIFCMTFLLITVGASAEDKSENGGWFSGWFSSEEQKAAAQQQAKESSGWFSGWFSSEDQKAAAQQQAKESSVWFSGWFSSEEQKAAAQQQAKESSGWFSGWFSSEDHKAAAQQQAKESSGWFSGWLSSEDKREPSTAYKSQIDRQEFNKQRQSWWKSLVNDDYGEENRKRMKEGKAPIGPDGNPIELHHVNGQPNGPIVPLTKQDHRQGQNYQKNHPWLFDPKATPQKYQNYGLPSQKTGNQRTQWVNGYTRKNGTQVGGYWRSQSQK